MENLETGGNWDEVWCLIAINIKDTGCSENIVS